jgi:hypothetical protein
MTSKKISVSNKIKLLSGKNSVDAIKRAGKLVYQLLVGVSAYHRY